MDNFRNLYDDGFEIRYPDGDRSLERFPMLFPDDFEDRLHTVLQDETLLTIAHFYYKDSRQWWKIADRNNLDDIFNLELGSELIIPNVKKQ